MYIDLRSQLARADWEIGRFLPKTKLTFHWAGPSPAYPPTFDPIERAKIFARYHRSKDWGGGARGDGLMYHYVLGEDVVYIARDEDAILYATGTDANRTSWHALFPIFEGESPTPGMYRAAAWLRANKGVPAQGHRDEGTSACPGDEIAAWIVRPDNLTVLGSTTKRLPDEPQFPRDLVSLYETLAPRAGIRAEIAFAQMLHETDHWRFTGDVPASYNNPAGLGATGGAGVGSRFDTREDGVRAQLGHLLWYFGPHIPEFCDKDQRHFGDHKNLPNDIRRLNGRWAVPGDQYGERIAAIAAAFEEEDMDTAELERRIDAKIAAYGARLQPELEVDRKRIDSLESRVNAINIAGEHDHEIPVTRTGGPAKR